MVQADVETDEVYAQMTLQPLSPVHIISRPVVSSLEFYNFPYFLQIFLL